jgi:ComF family protein
MTDALDSITERWIGWTFPPVMRAIDDADWKPDSRDAYCFRCGDSVGPGETTSDGCGSCREGAEFEGGIGDGVIRLGPYSEELRDWILKIKYQKWTEMAECVGGLLAQAIRSASVVDLNRTIIVPMPMPWQRRIFRGTDHSRVIAHAMARKLHSPVLAMLAKSLQAPQVTLPPSERRRAGGRGLRVRRRLGGWNLQGVHVIVVDDVRTTGATMKAAVRMLRTLKPDRIVCAVVAVSDSKARRDRKRRADQVLVEVPSPVLVEENKSTQHSFD